MIQSNNNSNNTPTLRVPKSNPISPHSNNRPEWKEPIIHIVNTRFMQNQGHLLTLARARLHLFSTFCLPSMMSQSTQNFIWIIKIDPQLHETLRKDLIHMVKGYHVENVYIIASDVNYLIGHDPGSWRSGQEREEVWSHVGNGTLYTGNVDRLLAAKEWAQDKIILETRLDADDGLNRNYLKTVQEAAIQKFGGALASQEDEDNGEGAQWFYWCVERHIKWYLDMDRDLNMGPIDQNSYQDDDIGFVATSTHTNYCITPGLTVGWNVKGRHEPFANNHVLQEPPTNISHADLYHHILNTHQGQCGLNDCLQFIQIPLLSALRTRTFTSAGMKDVDFEKDSSSAMTRDENVEAALWGTIETSFEVSTSDVKETQKYFRENVIQIATENLEGQCSKGMHVVLFSVLFSK